MRRFRNVMTRDLLAASERARPDRAFCDVSDVEGFLSLQTGRAERQCFNVDARIVRDLYEFAFMFMDGSWRRPA